MKNITRIEKAGLKYSEQLQDLLNNPVNENLSNEIIEPKIKNAFGEYLQALLQDEDECVAFVSKGNIPEEIIVLPLIFEHFKSVKIYNAIKTNCEIAFSCKYSTESKELEQKRKDLIDYMQSTLNLK